MKVTTQWIADKFVRFNKEYFNDFLTMPNFSTSTSVRALGNCKVRNMYCSPTYEITLSNFYDREEKDFCNTLLHEMIHLYFFQQDMFHEGHGKNFQRMARSFDKYGWNIHTTNEKAYDAASATIPKRTILSFYETRTQKVWVCCISNNKVSLFYNHILKHSDKYTNVQLYETTNSKFASLVVSQSRLSGITMSQTEFNEQFLPLLNVSQMSFC